MGRQWLTKEKNEEKNTHKLTRKANIQKIQSESIVRANTFWGHREQIGQPNKHVKFITINVHSSDTLEHHSFHIQAYLIAHAAHSVARLLLS